MHALLNLKMVLPVVNGGRVFLCVAICTCAHFVNCGSWGLLLYWVWDAIVTMVNSSPGILLAVCSFFENVIYMFLMPTRFNVIQILLSKMHHQFSNLARSIIWVPKLSKCIFRSSNLLLIVSQKFLITILNCKAEVFWLMCSLHVGPNFIFKFLHSTLIFLKFSPKFYFQTLCHKIFLMFPPKFISFIFWFLQVLSWFLIPYNFLYRSFVFKHIFTSKFFMIFLYILYTLKSA